MRYAFHFFTHYINQHKLSLWLFSFLLLCCTNCKSNAQTSKSTGYEKVKVGSKLPHFALKDQNGKLFDIDSVKGKKNLVIYFYPKDDTPGCTKEACSFRDQFEVFQSVDAMVIGISAQSVESHLAFAQKYHLNFTLLSDPDQQVIQLFGVPTSLFGMLLGRVTYVVNKAGAVVYVFNSQTQATKHVEEALRILKSLR